MADYKSSIDDLAVHHLEGAGGVTTPVVTLEDAKAVERHLRAMGDEVAHWREAIQAWVDECPCFCEGCQALARAVREAERTFPEQYDDGEEGVENEEAERGRAEGREEEER